MNFAIQIATNLAKSFIENGSHVGSALGAHLAV
jgi:hypothetical protein